MLFRYLCPGSLPGARTSGRSLAARRLHGAVAPYAASMHRVRESGYGCTETEWRSAAANTATPAAAAPHVLRMSICALRYLALGSEVCPGCDCDAASWAHDNMSLGALAAGDLRFLTARQGKSGFLVRDRSVVVAFPQLKMPIELGCRVWGARNSASETVKSAESHGRSGGLIRRITASTPPVTTLLPGVAKRC